MIITKARRFPCSAEIEMADVQFEGTYAEMRRKTYCARTWTLTAGPAPLRMPIIFSKFLFDMHF